MPQVKSFPFPRWGWLESQLKFRIPSLDGGGIKGAFSAAALERETETSAADDFDRIVGNSTGGSMALGLGLRKSAQDIVELA